MIFYRLTLFTSFDWFWGEKPLILTKSASDVIRELRISASQVTQVLLYIKLHWSFSKTSFPTLDSVQHYAKHQIFKVSKKPTFFPWQNIQIQTFIPSLLSSFSRMWKPDCQVQNTNNSCFHTLHVKKCGNDTKKWLKMSLNISVSSLRQNPEEYCRNGT